MNVHRNLETRLPKVLPSIDLLSGRADALARHYSNPAMKHLPLSRAGLSLFAVVFLVVPCASALVELDRAVITLNTQASVAYDSNILGRLDDESDTMLTFAPTLEYRREGGRGSMVFTLGSRFVHYLDNDDRNHEDFSFGGLITVPVSPDSPFSGSFNASFSDATRVDETVGNLVKSDSLRFGGSAAYAFSERLSGTGSLAWGSTDNENFGDHESFNLSVGISLQQFLFRRLPLSVSYGYSTHESTNDTGTARELDTVSHSLNFGTSGQISPKVSGSVSVGVRDTDDSGTQFANGRSGGTGVVASTSLNWTADELNAVSLSLTKSLGVAADNQSIDTTRVGLSWNRRLSEQLTANAGIAHSWNSYRATTRDDEYLTLNAGLNYQIRRHWSAGLSYSYSDNSSNIRAIQFQRHVLGASLSARF